MTIDQVIALSASIGAFMSAIAAFLAVKQNTKQREASYKPELAITRTTFTASKNPISKSSFADFWVEDRPENEKGNVNLLLSLSLPLRNVGLGAAKEVNLKWSFAIEKLVSDINEKAQKTLIPAYFKYENEVLALKSEQLDAAISIWGNQKHVVVDYVLPAATDLEGVRVNVPHAYMELVSALIYFSSKEEDRSFPDVPVLEVQLEYYDIGGVKHSASFGIELYLIAIYGDGEGFHGYLQSKKIA
jgi:hypothetical protein